MDLNLQTIFHFIDDGSLTGTPGFPISSSLGGDFEIDYDATGPFLGGTYGFIIGEKGMLSLNLAVAFLDGDLTQNGRYIDPRTGSIDETFNLNTTGDSIGFSYGFGWRSSLTDRLGYYVYVKGFNYKFDADDSDKSDFQEKAYQFSLGLSYVF